MDQVFIVMGSYRNEPEAEVIFGVYKTCESARQAVERLTWDSSIASAYVWAEKVHE